MQIGRAVPILRIFDEERAEEFYVDYLGMRVDWEHRYEPSFPLYLQVSRGDCVLHLSEHHGDGTPGTVVYIPPPDVRDLHAEIAAKPYAHLRPGLHQHGGETVLQLLDPFGNTLRFEHRHGGSD